MEQRIKTRQASDFADAVDARIEAATSSVVQPLDATLTALAAITTAADKLIYATGADAFSTTTLTAAARDLLDDVDASAMRTTLGLGTMATAAAADYLPLAGGTMTGNLTISGASLFVGGSYAIAIGDAGNGYYGGWMANTYLALSPNTVFGWNSGDGTTVKDLVLARDAADALALRRSTNAQTFRVYGTYTDASNHVRASLAATSTSVTLAAQTAGTGADDVDLYLRSAGRNSWISIEDGNARVDQSTYGGGYLFDVTFNYVPYFRVATGYNLVGLGYSMNIVWHEERVGTTQDTGISRTSAGLVEVNNGTPGTYRDLKVRTFVATNAGSNAKLVDFTSPDWAIRDGTGGGGGIYISNSSFSSMVAFQTGGLGISHGTSFWWSAFPNSQGANTAIARSSNGVVQINTGSNNSFGDLQLRTLQGFYSYTDGSNYQGYKLTSGATSVTLSAETAGTGADNVDVNITPAGTGQTVVTNLYAHRDFSTAYSYGKMIQVTGVEGRTATFGTFSGQPAIAFGSDLTTNFAANGYIYGHSGCLQFVGGANNIRFWNSIEIGYPATFHVATGGGVITRNYLAICDSAAAATDGADVVLRRDAANILALRNGSNGQKLRVYGDYTGASQYCALELSCTQAGGDYFSHYIGPVNAGGSDYWNDNRGKIGGWSFLTIEALSSPSSDAGAIEVHTGMLAIRDMTLGGYLAFFDGRSYTSTGQYGHRNYFLNPNTASHTLGLWQASGHTKSALTVYTNSVLKADITSAGAFRSYGAWTDDSNYVRASLSAAASSVTLAAETAGTGADNVDVYVTPAGSGLVQLGAGANKATVDQFGQVTASGGGTLTSNTSGSFGAFQVCWGNGEGIGYGGTIFRSGFRLTWSQYGNQAQAGFEDTGLARNAAGVIEVNNGTPGTYRDIKARNFYFGDSGAYLFTFLGGAFGTYAPFWSESYFHSNVGGYKLGAGGGSGPLVALGIKDTGIAQIYDGTTLHNYRDLHLRTLQGFYSYTDGSNYQGYKLTSGASSVTLSAETAGTGADNIDLNLVPAGTGNVSIGVSGAALRTVTASTQLYLLNDLFLFDNGDGARIWLQTLQNNNGPIHIKSAGYDGLKVLNTGGVTIDNAASPDTVATLTLNARGTQLAPLLNAGGFTVNGTGTFVTFGHQNSASYPALKRNSTELQVRLADDSGYAELRAKNIYLDGSGGQQIITTASYLVFGTSVYKMAFDGAALYPQSGTTNGVDIGTINYGFTGMIRAVHFGTGCAENPGTFYTSAYGAVGALELRSGTTAQTLRVYGTYTDASNYVRASLAATSTAVTLAAETAGTGADDVDVNITTAGNGKLIVKSSGTLLQEWHNSGGTVLARLRNTSNRGVIELSGNGQLVIQDDSGNNNGIYFSGSSTVGVSSNFTAGGQITIGGATGGAAGAYLIYSATPEPRLHTGVALHISYYEAQYSGTHDLLRFGWHGGWSASAPTYVAYSAITENSGAGDYGLAMSTSAGMVRSEKLRITSAGLVTFGGITSSYPALKRNGTELQVRLADDSGYAGINAASYTFSGGASLNFNGSEISSAHRLLSSTGLVSEGYLAIGPWPNYTYLYAAGADIFEQRRTTNAQTLRVYGTYTDASNYVRASLAATSTSVTLAAQTAGTGADEISINLTPAGAYAARLVLEGSATSNPGWSIGETAASPCISGSSGAPNSISFKAYSFSWEQVNVGTAMVIESGTGCVGIGTTSPTAYLDLPASTTSAASLRIRTGTAPTSPNSGDVWHDSTQNTLSYYAAGVEQTVNGVLFTQTQTVTVANTVTETALTGTGTGTLTLPANFFAAGKTIKIRALGYHSSTASPNITIRVKLGSTTILTTGAIASGNGSDDAWVCDAFFTCRTTGGTGTVIGQGYYEEVHGNGNRGGMVNTATTTIDTTESQAISITVEWGTADAGNTISCTNVLIEVLN